MDSCDLFNHILHDFFTGPVAVIWLPQCQWRNHKGYELHLSIAKHNDAQQNKNYYAFI